MGYSSGCTSALIGVFTVYGVVHMDGSGEDDPPVENLSGLYDELELSGIVEGNVAVIHDDTGWCMSAHRDGRLVFENLESRGECALHMMPVLKERVMELWQRLIDGDIDGLLLEAWQRGYSDV